MPRLDDSPRWDVLPARPERERRLVAELGIPPLVARVLAARGICDPGEARAFLSPSLERDWHDPLEIPGMGAAADRVGRAIDAHEVVAIFGDYDVDGMTAASLLARALARLGADVHAFVPHRFDEGYGLSEAALARVRRACSPALLVTVDNGIAAAHEVEGLVADGIDVVVTDHHEAGDLVPRGVPVTNPKLAPDGPSHELAGAGVALKLVCELGRRRGMPDLWRDYTDLAALGTLSDMMLLTPENRALVADGVARIRSSTRPGIQALAAAAGIDLAKVRPDTLPFSLIPRLNAAGRMGTTDVAFDLLHTDDPAEASVLAGRLEQTNTERRRIEADLAQEALAKVEATYDGGRVVVVGGVGWHEGVKGIVASRIVGRYHVPAILFSIQDGLAKGSGRSVGTVDLFHAVEQCSDMLVRFGGHAGAVGVTLEADRLDEFRARLSSVMEGLPAEQFQDRGEVAAVVGLSELTQDAIEGLELMQPFGQGNKRPLFAVRDVSMRNRSRVGAEASHLRFVATDGRASRPAIMFRAPDIGRAAAWEGPCDLVFDAVNETWQGRTKPKLMVKDILLPDEGAAAGGGPRRDGTAGTGGRKPATPAGGAGEGGRRGGANPAPAGTGGPTPAGAARRQALAALSDTALDGELRRVLVGGHELLPAQAAALRILAAGRSCLAVMATGRGKSLVFHYHAARLAIRRHQASVFVYPLRALVADQAFHLGRAFEALGLTAAVLTGETPADARADAYGRLADGSLDVVLTTPEYLAIHARELGAPGRVGFVVVDEAHHAGRAGRDGRDAYGRLPETLATLGRPQALATSATLGTDEARQVCDLLGIDGRDVVVDATARENLLVDDLRGTDGRTEALAAVAASGEKCVAYVGAREQARSVVRELRRLLPAQGGRIAFYHAGLPRADRARVEDAFRSGAVSCVVSTSAFGEGVNLPDVRHVALYQLPFGRVAFNQMSGRAGRDGLPATVHLLYGEGDVAADERILSSQAPARDDLVALWQALRAQARASGGTVRADDGELAEEAARIDRSAHLTPGAVEVGLSVFAELGFLAVSGFADAREVSLVARPARRDLLDSARYQEGLRERRAFDEFADWALSSPAGELVAHVRRPILPSFGSVVDGAGS